MSQSISDVRHVLFEKDGLSLLCLQFAGNVDDGLTPSRLVTSERTFAEVGEAALRPAVVDVIRDVISGRKIIRVPVAVGRRVT